MSVGRQDGEAAPEDAGNVGAEALDPQIPKSTRTSSLPELYSDPVTPLFLTPSPPFVTVKTSPWSSSTTAASISRQNSLKPAARIRSDEVAMREKGEG